MSLKSKWLLYSILGLLLVGGGLSVFGEALFIKALTPESRGSWFIWGTGSLILINAGLSFIGQAVIFKVKLERQKENNLDR
jgi:hypothetical protein